MDLDYSLNYFKQMLHKTNISLFNIKIDYKKDYIREQIAQCNLIFNIEYDFLSSIYSKKTSMQSISIPNQGRLFYL